MKEKMMKVFDETIKELENVETFILIVGGDGKQLNNLQGKCKKALAQLIVESAEAMELVEDALKKAKVQIKINEVVAEAKKWGITLPGMDDEAEAEEKE